MATTKITDLTAYTDPVSTDVVPIVDVTSDVTKKVSIADLMENAGSGTEALPGISFDGDPNTGIYRPGADQVAISTGGTGRLFVAASGNVIVPDSIQVGNASGVGAFSVRAATNGNIHFRNITDITGSGTGVGIDVLNDANTAVNDFALRGATTIFRNASSETLRIDSSGRVGIGTSAFSSGAKAEIATASGQERIYIQGNNNSSNSYLYIEAPANRRKAVVFRSGGSDRACIGVGDSDELAESTLFLSANVNSGGTSPHMVIDSSGRVGIGTTLAGNSANKLSVRSDSASSIVDALLLNNGSVDNAAGTGVRINFSGVSETNSDIRYAYIESATASINNDHYIAFGTNSASTTPVERARITSSGQLLVGTSTGSGNELFIVKGDLSSPDAEAQISLRRGGGIVATDRTLGQINFQASNGDYKGAWIRARSEDGWSLGTSHPTRLEFSTTPAGSSSPVVACRINSSQQLLVNASGSIASFNDGRIEVASKASQLAIVADATASSAIGIGIRGNTSTTAVSFFNASDGATCGTIVLNSGSTSYNTSSDYRLKENVTPVTDGITRLQQLKPSRFNFIADATKTVDGFLAHEVQTVVPEAITGEKDAVDDEGNPEYQGIDQSKLVPLLTAALQEAIAKIESLEARLTAAGI